MFVGHLSPLATAAKAPVEGAKAAKDMESLFLKVLWQEMWKTVGSGQGAGQGSFLPAGLAGDVYKDMLFQSLSDRMADAGGVGLAKLISNHLS